MTLRRLLDLSLAGVNQIIILSILARVVIVGMVSLETEAETWAVNTVVAIVRGLEIGTSIPHAGRLELR